MRVEQNPPGGMVLPSLTVIVPTYNSAETLHAALQSIVDQDYPRIEVLIIDKVSTDGTLDIARQFQKSYGSIRLVSQVDSGIYDAMNRGIDLSRGEWIYFLGSDDVLMPTALRSVFTMCNPEDFDLLYGNVYFNPSGVIYDNEFSPLKLTDKNICHQAEFFHRRLFERLGKFDVRYVALADWEFNWRCFGDERVRIGYVPFVIAEYSGQGFSSRHPDYAFLLDRLELLITHFKGGLHPDQLHELIWPTKVRKYVEQTSLIRGFELMARAALRTRRPIRYLSAALFWKIRSVLHLSPTAP